MKCHEQYATCHFLYFQDTLSDTEFISFNSKRGGFCSVGFFRLIYMWIGMEHALMKLQVSYLFIDPKAHHLFYRNPNFTSFNRSYTTFNSSRVLPFQFREVERALLF